MKKYSALNPTVSVKPKHQWLFLLFLVCLIFYWETSLRLLTLDVLVSPGLFFSLVFGIIFALISYVLILSAKIKYQFSLSIIWLIFFNLIFLSQYIYYQVFQTFYSLYSVGNAKQIIQFIPEIILVMKQHWWRLLILIWPTSLFIILARYALGIIRLKLKKSIKLLALSISFYALAILGLQIDKVTLNSPFNLYYNIHSPNQAVNKLGLLTYVRLNGQRQLTHWSEKLIEDPLPDPNIPDPVIPEPTIEYNNLDIDFGKLIATEKNETIRNMHIYFSNQTGTQKNYYTGKYAGYNLIVLTAEAFSHLAVHPDITPTLYKMVHEGFFFKNFYTPLWNVSTSDGEYVANVGLLPKSDVWSFFRSSTNYLPFAFGNQLKQLGYSTRAYHDHTYTYYYRHLSHPNLGYLYQGVGNGLNVKTTWPESDLEMMQLTIPKYIKDEPFHTYYMTVSGHLNYTFNGNAMASKNRKYVENLNYSPLVKGYLAAQIELDRALEYLLSQLEKAGILDKTVIALSADHYPYGLKQDSIEELAGGSVDKNFELYRNAFILYNPTMVPTTITEPASSLDIVPTISNLFGLPYDSRLLMGRDLLDKTSFPLVIFENRSFIISAGRYNSLTDTFTPNLNQSITPEELTRVKQLVNQKFYYSTKILELDYYRKVFKP